MLALLTAACGAVPTGETVGWGELQEDWRGEVERLSWSPRAYRVHGFLTAAECDHIINLAKPKLEVSLVVDNESGAFKASEVRTSTGAAFGRSYDQVLTRIERRIAAVTMMPLEHQEGLQVLRYVDGQKYEPHMDSFWDPKNQAREHGGQRVVTFLMYLSTPEEGGETVFPKGTPKAQGLGWSECARQGFAVKAKRGDALMFYSLKPDGALDPASEHGSCPTLKGEKYSATKWLHVWPFGVDKQPGPCEDQNEMCAEWAYFGECEKNPAYMLVACKHSCRVPCDA